MHQIVLTLRGLVRQPGFSAIAILTLALGIGSTTTVFSVARAFLDHPELAEGADPVIVWGTNRVAGQVRDVVSGPTFLDLRRQNRTLAGLSAFHFTDVTLRGGDRANVISASKSRLISSTSPASGPQSAGEWCNRMTTATTESLS